jgi:hypothetical protein
LWAVPGSVDSKGSVERQSTVKRGVGANAENKGVARSACRKQKTPAGNWRYEMGGELLLERHYITLLFFVKQKKRGELAEGVRETFLRDGVPFRDLERLLDWGRMVAIGKRTATKRSDLRRVDIREAKNH